MCINWRIILSEYIKMQRTMCFGTYPVYRATVDNRDNANYYRAMFVYKKGGHHWKIAKKKAEQSNE